MTRERLFSDQRLAEILHEACGDKKRITPSEYAKWYNSKSATPMDYPKNFQTFVDRLGGGRVPDTFKHMRKLLGLPEEEPEEPSKKKERKVNSKSELKPEANLAAISYKLINTLGYSFDIGHIHIKTTHDGWRAVIEKTERITAQSDVVMSRQLKLTQDITGQLIDFPPPEEGVFYLIDGKLYREMLSLWPEGRDDLIPVYHKDNYPSDSQPPTLNGFYVYPKYLD